MPDVFCPQNLSGFCTNLHPESPQEPCCGAFLQAKTGLGILCRCHSQQFHPESCPQTLQQACLRVLVRRSGQESFCVPSRKVNVKDQSQRVWHNDFVLIQLGHVDIQSIILFGFRRVESDALDSAIQTLIFNLPPQMIHLSHVHYAICFWPSFG